MANLTRYDMEYYNNDDGDECYIEISRDGEWVKFEDIKEFLKTPTNTGSMPCPIGLHEIKVNVKPVGNCDPTNLHDAAIWYQALKSCYIYMCKRLGHSTHA